MDQALVDPLSAPRVITNREQAPDTVTDSYIYREGLI